MQFKIGRWLVLRFLPQNPPGCEHKKTTFIEGSPSVAHAMLIPRLQARLFSCYCIQSVAVKTSEKTYKWRLV